MLLSRRRIGTQIRVESPAIRIISHVQTNNDGGVEPSSFRGDDALLPFKDIVFD
jgi:hypothetical protein